MSDVQLLKAIFFQASELRLDAERAAYLDSACQGDPELRWEVERMLDALRAGDAGLEPSTGVQAVAAAETLRQQSSGVPSRSAFPGAIFDDRYELTELLGEGGMGTVWKARQRQPVARWVAIKLVRALCGSRQTLDRFERERLVLATMDHPHIARILDSGQTDRGDPYVVMELVQGCSITQFCEQNQLNVRERLTIFLEVCHAVRHAHQKGIIHRDLKPSNILIADQDGRAVPKIIDFGLAKPLGAEAWAQESADGLSVGMVLGTPLYMAPERFATQPLDADVRDDVYSLGVLLYRLLTETTPVESRRLEGLPWNEVIRLIREENPTPPSSRIADRFAGSANPRKPHRSPCITARQVHGELDWIALAALAQERERRYASVDALASDIERFLSGEPVAAAPPSRWYRIHKFLKKHRGEAMAATIAVAALVVGVAVSGAAFYWAVQEKQNAETAEARTEQELVRTREVKQLITRMLEGISPQRAQGGDVAMLRSILDDTAERLAAGEIQDELILAEMHRVVGDIFRQLGIYEQAEFHLTRSCEKYVTRLGKTDEATLDARSKLANVRYRQGHWTEALQRYGEIELDCRQTLGPDHPLSVGVLHNLGAVFYDLGRYSESEQTFQRVLALRQESLGPEHADTLATLSNLATLYRKMDRFDQAEKLLLEAREIKGRTLGERHPSTLHTLNNLANLYADQGRRAEAEQLYRHCLALRQVVLGPAHPETLGSLNNLAVLLKEQGKIAEAETIYQELLDSKTRVLGRSHPSTLQTMDNLAILFADAGRPTEAEALYRETLASRSEILGEQHPDTLATVNNLAVLLENQQRWDEAEKLYRQALAAKLVTLGPDHRDTELTMLNLGNLYSSMNRWTEAEPMFRTVLEQTTARGQTHSPQFRRAQQGLDRVQASQSRSD